MISPKVSTSLSLWGRAQGGQCRMKSALHAVVPYNLKDTFDSLHSSSLPEVQKRSAESKVYRQAVKEKNAPHFFLLGRKSWRENASPNFLCLQFARLLLGLFLTKTENPEENKLAANQSIICCLKMSFPLFPPTDLASTAIFTFWKAGKQMLLPYALLLLWHFLLQKETVQKKTQPFFADKREPADYLGWSLVYHKPYIYHAIPPPSTVISAKLKHLRLFWLNGALPQEKDLQIFLILLLGIWR